MEPLTRITYRDATTGQPRTQSTVRRESLVDYENYLRPLERAHGSGLHSPGVALGFEVRAAQGAAGIRVLPGLALSADGDHIMLAAGGRAVVAGTRVPVAAGGVQIPTTGLNGVHVLTVSRDETDDERSFDGETRKICDHTPRLNLRLAAGSVDDRVEVVLAEITLAAGTVTELNVGSRRQCAEQVTVRRPQASASGAELTAGSHVAAELRSALDGGLKVTVASPGNFTIEGDGLVLVSPAGTTTLEGGKVTSSGTLEISKGLKVTGGTLDAQQGLRVTGPLSVNGTLSMTGGALTVDKITSTGQPEVSKGLKVTGGSLDAEQGLRVTGPLTVNGPLSLTGGTLSIDKITSAGQLEVSKGLKITGGALDALQGLRVTGGSLEAQGGLTVTGNSSVGGALTVGVLRSAGGPLAVQGGLTVAGGALTVEGITSAGLVEAQSLRVGGHIAAQMDLSVAGTVSVGNGMRVQGATEVTAGLTGVLGVGTDNSIQTAGVKGLGNGFDATGVIGEAHNGPQAFGVWGKSTSGKAGVFDGVVHVRGNLIKSSGGFQIDHPLDPENKYLSHSFVESPDMLNVYCGNIETDDQGDADVSLPDYFAELNEEFTYQLTVIGRSAHAVVAEEIRDNRFTVRTDQPNVKVSWHVTGVRKDPFAVQNRIVVEEGKAGDQLGKYLHPEVYGKPRTQYVDYGRERVLDDPRSE